MARLSFLQERNLVEFNNVECILVCALTAVKV